MPSLLTREYLSELGIELDDQSYHLLSDHFDTTLHDRVIDEVVADLTPEQAAELAHMQSNNDEAIYAWIQQNVPEFSAIVSDEIDILLGEVAEDSEKFS